VLPAPFPASRMGGQDRLNPVEQVPAEKRGVSAFVLEALPRTTPA
jgi:hypothetical protein